MLIKTGKHSGLWRPSVPAIQNKDTWQSLGLLGWWPAGPTWRDASTMLLLDRVGGHHGVVGGAALAAPGQMGFAVAPSGNSSFSVSTTGRLAFPSSEGTVTYWAKLLTASPASDDFSGFGMQFLPASSASHYPLTTGLIYIGEMSSDRPINAVSPLADVTRTEWHMVTVTSKAGANNYRFFQNGRLVTQATRGGWPSLLATARLMGTSFGASPFAMNGWGCDFRIYNRALTDAEVWELYQPSTRWDLYWQPQRSYVFLAAAGGGAGSARSRTFIVMP
jgi:hypothetical protein